LSDYLSAISWPGSIPDLPHLLNTFGATIEHIRFDLTIGDEISSRLGLEFFSKGLDQNQAKRRRFLNQLIAHNLCTPAKGLALVNWAGFSREMFTQHTRPTRLERAWYVKLVVQTNHPLEAKGYLGFTPNYITPFSLI
jgi:hypothetical protein